MDDLRSLIAGDQPATPTTSTAPTTSKRNKEPTSQELYGIKDLQDSLSQIQSTLPDLVPGSASHKRALADIQSIQSELQRHPGATSQATQAQPAQSSGDSLRDLIVGTSAEIPTTSAGGGRGGQGGPTAAQVTSYVPPAPTGVVGQALQKAFQLKQRAPGEIASALDVVGNIPSQIAGTVGYGAGRLFGLNPEEATAAAAPVSQALANPAGRLMGVTDQPGYQASLPAMAQQAVGGVIGKGAEALGQKTGISPTDIEQGVTAAMMAAPMLKAPLGRATTAIKAALPEYTIEHVGTTPTLGNAGASGLGSAGAAAATDAAKVNELLGRASPELQTAAKTIVSQGQQINLKALENQVKAEQFGMKLTKGEALQDLGLLSEEYNSKKTDPDMADHLSNRNPKLAQGFQDIRAQVAPDVYEPDPIKAANIALEDLVQKDASSKSIISKNYKAAADANGGELPLNGKDFVEQAELQLKNTGPNLYRYVPPKIQGILDELKTTGNMSLNDFEFYKTLFDNERRLAERQGDKTTALAISKVLQGLESTPMSEASAPVKALYDTARQSAKQRFDLIEKNPAYKAAISDTRTPDEIAQGVLHPAANKFLDNFYSSKTPEVNIKRLVNLLGQNSEAHQGLNAAIIDKIAQFSGVKGGANDVVSQAALNKQVRSVYQTNLPSMLPPEGLQRLHDLADVAALTEHVKPGTYSNVSGTAIAATQSPAMEFAKKAAEGAVQTGITSVSPAAGVAYGLAKAHLTGRAATKAAAAEAALAAARKAETFKIGAGIDSTPLNKIGK